MSIAPTTQTQVPEATASTEDCIVILAPYGQDAALMAEVLGHLALTRPCADMEQFCATLTQCAVGVLTTDALDPNAVQRLVSVLRAQPPWSDIPLVILSARIDPASYSLLADALGNVTIIQRPLDVPSLLTVVGAALRARAKQYQIRDLLAASSEQQSQIQALNERLRRAMTETHHRVKNSLQIISAFIDIQANEYKAAVPTEEVKRINSQVRTLAAVHDVLTQETKRNYTADFVSAKLLLEQLFPLISHIVRGKRLKYHVEDVRLSSGQGTSLALIANELVLNALKHSGNVVEVELSVNSHTATLAVCDDGPGLPEGFNVSSASNTGLALVENLARWDLRGETQYANREDGSGARIEVTFPIG